MKMFISNDVLSHQEYNELMEKYFELSIIVYGIFPPEPEFISLFDLHNYDGGDFYSCLVLVEVEGNYGALDAEIMACEVPACFFAI